MSTMTEIKTMSFEKVLPDLKRFAASKNSPRPVLVYTYYDGQYLHATDSHKAIRINSRYIENLPQEDNFLCNVYNNELTDKHNYPEINRLYPEFTKAEIKLSNTELNKVKKAMENINKNAKVNVNSVMTLNVKSGKVTFSSINKDTGYEESLPLDNVIHTGEDFSIDFNAQYFKNMLVSCSKLNKLCDHDFTHIKFTGKLRPLIITNNEVYDILLLPVRIY